MKKKKINLARKNKSHLPIKNYLRQLKENDFSISECKITLIEDTGAGFIAS